MDDTGHPLNTSPSVNLSEHPFQLDYERWDGDMLASKEQQAQFARYRAGHQAVLPDQQSDTHPRLQPYKAGVDKLRKAGLKAPAGIFDPTEPIPRAKSGRPATPAVEDELDEASEEGARLRHSGTKRLNSGRVGAAYTTRKAQLC
ncbi:uncharacterized protein BKCO1_1000164 [Diplodia corticola]|uniref:Uncharacterized protein n=1 Tax=Diplodia corticola TaxID=236234 RepID=A0A1J9RIT1_9PEZI|nr:uncharacterized protein BKCO1_1000164 [Diplodia corticola]OJD40560.1 hypothetical protein BKCO1_1000164 [Diplodia corticola]